MCVDLCMLWMLNFLEHISWPPRMMVMVMLGMFAWCTVECITFGRLLIVVWIVLLAALDGVMGAPVGAVGLVSVGESRVRGVRVSVLIRFMVTEVCTGV